MRRLTGGPGNPPFLCLDDGTASKNQILTT
jgi:hypothetical protein